MQPNKSLVVPHLKTSKVIFMLRFLQQKTTQITTISVHPPDETTGYLWVPRHYGPILYQIGPIGKVPYRSCLVGTTEFTESTLYYNGNLGIKAGDFNERVKSSLRKPMHILGSTVTKFISKEINVHSLRSIFINKYLLYYILC